MVDSFAISTLEQLVPNPNSSYLNPPYCLHKCNHCSKAFSSTQALGGHQNAHQRDKRKEKRPQKSPFINKKRGKYNPIKPQNDNLKPPRTCSSELNIYLDDGPFREPKTLECLNFRVGSIVPFGSGSSCNCGKVATSWPVHVARFRLSKDPDTGVVVHQRNLPQVKIFGGEKEKDNSQALDLSLKL